MITFLLVAVAMLSVAALLLFGSMVELYRQLLQLRQHVGMVDHAQSLKFNSHITLSDLPVPVPMHDLRRAALLILSDRCTTCYRIAEHMNGRVPDGVAVLVEARSVEDARAWSDSHGIADKPEVIYDGEGRFAERLGVSVTPAVIKFESQYALSAMTVPSTRQYDRIVDWVLEGTESRNAIGMITNGARP